MKHLAVILLLIALASCYRPDQRVVGRFHASDGDILDIRSDGYIWFLRAGNKDERVGLVTIFNEAPLTIRVIAPDTSPLIGTQIVFTSDRRHIAVEWPQWPSAQKVKRPTAFQKQ